MVVIIDVVEGTILKRLTGHVEEIHCLSWQPLSTKRGNGHKRGTASKTRAIRATHTHFNQKNNDRKNKSLESQQ